MKTLKDKNNKMKNKSGFTIIEVVLVLAIAGLIFLMIFLALPALQRSQRDIQRKNDVATTLSKIKQWKANNRNASLKTAYTNNAFYVGQGSSLDEYFETTHNRYPGYYLYDYGVLSEEINQVSINIAPDGASSWIRINLERTIQVFEGFTCDEGKATAYPDGANPTISGKGTARSKIAAYTELESGGIYCQSL